MSDYTSWVRSHTYDLKTQVRDLQKEVGRLLDAGTLQHAQICAAADGHRAEVEWLRSIVQAAYGEGHGDSDDWLSPDQGWDQSDAKQALNPAKPDAGEEK